MQANQPTPTEESLNQELARLTSQLKELKTYLPYADGQAYYQDKERIRITEREIKSVQSKLKALKEQAA